VQSFASTIVAWSLGEEDVSFSGDGDGDAGFRNLYVSCD